MESLNPSNYLKNQLPIGACKNELFNIFRFIEGLFSLFFLHLLHYAYFFVILQFITKMILF